MFRCQPIVNYDAQHILFGGHATHAGIVPAGGIAFVTFQEAAAMHKDQHRARRGFTRGKVSVQSGWTVNIQSVPRVFTVSNVSGEGWLAGNQGGLLFCK